MSSALNNRTIALAGLYQCAELVVQIAWQGRAESKPFAASINSLFKIDVDHYPDVYGGYPGLELGLSILKATLDKQEGAHVMERTRYAVTLLFLGRKLSKNTQHIEIIQNGVENASAQLKHFESTHINVISNLADTYQQAVSPLGPKIIVSGEQSHLTNPDNASRIRALLLAGIRAVILWEQAGGKRWRLLFERNATLRQIEALSTAI